MRVDSRLSLKYIITNVSKMIRTLIYSVGFLLLTQLLIPALGLECYECFGPKGENHDCEVNLENVNLKNCTPGFVCTLYVNSVNNQSIIHRLCSELNECDVVAAKNTHLMGNNTIETCISCNTTGCNTASTYLVNSSLYSLVLGSFAILVINKFVM